MKISIEPILSWLRARKVLRYIPKKGRVCDIGCGKDASFLFGLKNYIEEGVGYDLDVSPGKYGNIILKKIDILKDIPEPSDHFDAVVLLAALEHLQYSNEILAECRRILKPGGRLLMTTPSRRAKPILDFLGFKIGIISRELLAQHKQYFTIESLSELAQSAGFDKEKIKVRPFEFGCNLFVSAIK